jgi:hypothetical protein
MASSTAASSKGPRYAPPDPTLPKPWRALIDGNTGYLYFWNPETKAVQYERPAPAAPAPPVSFSTSQSLPPGYGGPDERARSSVPSKVPTIPFLLPYEGMWLSARSRPARSSLFFSLDWIINVCEIHWYFSRARKLEGATRRMRLELMTGQG